MKNYKEATFTKRIHELLFNEKGGNEWGGDGYTLQLYRSSGDRKGRAYVASITTVKEIPKKVQYEDGKYTLDLESVKERDLPAHFIPYVKFD